MKTPPINFWTSTAVVVLGAINDAMLVEMSDPAMTEYRLPMRIASAVCMALVGFLPSLVKKRPKALPHAVEVPK